MSVNMEEQYDVKGKTALSTGAGSGGPSLHCTEKDWS
jgi:hypothetical protein